MNSELDFLYDDFLNDIENSSPVLSSDGTTDIFSDDLSSGERTINYLDVDFNPDDFLNDTESEPPPLSEYQNELLSPTFTSPSNSSDFNFNQIQNIDASQTSPPSSLEGEPILMPSSTLPVCASVLSNPESIAIPQEVHLLNGAAFGLIQQGPLRVDEQLTLLNLCNLTNKAAHEKIVLPKLEANKACSAKTGGGFLLNEKILRKQQRMIRNRESASLSTKKKKEYLSSLEMKVSSLEKENVELKCEVANLRNKITQITQTCNCNCRHFLSSNKSVGSHVKKNTAVLLAMVFMVSLNFGKFHSFFTPEVSFTRQRLLTPYPNVSSRAATRQLLWVNDTVLSEDIFEPLENFNESLTMRRIYINQTENRRLTSELRKLAHIGKKFKAPISNEDFDPVRYYALKSKKYLNNVPNDPIFNPEKSQYSRLFKKIHRKNDTFYILSFNNENILLPAASYNESSRPKMSLMLPTGNLLANKKIAFMQIDCEVLNTSTIQLKDSFVPANIRNHLKANNSPENKANITNKDKQKFGPERFPWKKSDFYGKAGTQATKTIGIPEIPSSFIPFSFN